MEERHEMVSTVEMEPHSLPLVDGGFMMYNKYKCINMTREYNEEFPVSLLLKRFLPQHLSASKCKYKIEKLSCGCCIVCEYKRTNVQFHYNIIIQ